MSGDWGWWGAGPFSPVVDWAVELEDALTGQRQVVKVGAADQTLARGYAEHRYPGFHVLNCQRWPE